MEVEYKLAKRSSDLQSTVIRLNNVAIGDGSTAFIAGSCSIESEEQILDLAGKLKAQGVHILRGGAYKPRTSPYDFQGLGELGLQYLSKAAKTHQLSCIAEVMEKQDIELVSQYADILQVGTRNMYNYSLLKALGRQPLPILLKRGFSASYKEWLLAAEYILMSGNDKVILCERGIRTFEQYTRNTADISAIAVIKQLSHLPIIFDPSHATGRRELIMPLSMAAVAAGADGLMIEVHVIPDQSVSDKNQTIDVASFAKIVKRANLIHSTVS